jgi:hypothetical protein
MALWRVVWGVPHGGAAWGLIMQHCCGIAAEVTSLNIGGCVLVTDEALRAESNCTALTSLNLSG